MTRIRLAARSVLIASGGAGQVYSDTTNPAVATGDGIALAALAGVPADGSSSVGWKAGAELADMEFYQFHPTALALEGAPRFLISEALRGEGAWLVNDRGERFMERYHSLLELAPRDVVARAIAREGMADPANPQSPPRTVYPDMRHVRNIDPASRFPGISAFLARYGLDLRRDLIPVRPAAHYLMGGIRTDLAGRTSVPGLYAAGEAPAPGCTAPIASLPIRFSKAWSLAHERRNPCSPILFRSCFAMPQIPHPRQNTCTWLKPSTWKTDRRSANRHVGQCRPAAR